MSSGVRRSLRWCMSLASKFSRVVFWHTLIIILLTLTSQISMVLAFFLPLKVVILLGSSGIPNYFPESLRVLGSEFLILGLSLSAVLFYIVHLLSEHLVGVVTARASGQILLHNKKVALFQNQDIVAGNAYKRFSRMLASSCFIFLALSVISVVYLDMAAILVFLAVVVGLLIAFLERTLPSFKDYLNNQMQDAAGIVASAGFFISFVYLVLDFIFLKPPSVIVAILSLLLCRQLFSRFSAVVKDIQSLSSQRVKIDALFFHNKVLLPSRARSSKGYWPFLERERRAEWIDAVISSFVEGWEGCNKVSWHSSSSPGIAVMIVEASSAANKYLVKLYEPKNSNLAMHESTLIAEGIAGLAAPTFVGMSSLGDMSCLVCRLPSADLSVSPNVLRKAVVKLKSDMLKIEPPAVLVDRYQRSRPLLWQRLGESDLQKIKVAATEVAEVNQVDRVIDRLPIIRTILQSMPLSFVNPDVRPANIWTLAQQEEPVFVNWGRWSLEPVGAGFGVGQREISQIEKALHAAAKDRPSLKNIDAKVVELVALVSALDERYGKHQLNEALDLLGPILERLDVLNFGLPLEEADHVLS
ncbi:hypothetical protein [Microbulbifer sediminum]|uniref:hypothetical protein n=1 Tax=Microbulbifer sediminum TaxID=2904250 RepID=UPI001F3E289F|nr:hypothetical protein [Microbulbifer sediminum]